MEQQRLTANGKPCDLHERLMLFACDIIGAGEFLLTRGLIGRALCPQLLACGTSVGANYEESDGASSQADFIAKNRIALKEAKESRFRLRVCRRRNLLDKTFDGLVQESDELVRILGKIVHNALRRKAAQRRKRVVR
jgi:four helix bundle protein